ncbi:sporulation integral membrane protein YtvI [Caloramator fervidus]|uniref:Sporulation integral membrane protein YtvI n=1 Tax=Caloramator fervidus TaxID=29344 RepID=A0A1H5WGX9_9CLOT|nr:sporulation integral membrane protein YtvI [Caloramator fervidus]SEF98471.1 sporulation integral membrane protein YtvI [Caloramator fervidus]
MFNKDFILKLKRFFIFLLIYTLLFFTFFKTLPYTLPFVLAIIIALINKPFNKFLIKQFKLPVALSSIITTGITFSLIFYILSLIIIKIISEARTLLFKIPNVDTLYPYIQNIIINLERHVRNLDPFIIEKLQTNLNKIFSSAFNMLQTLLNTILSFAIKLPSVFLIIIITFIATYFLSKDITLYEMELTSIFNENGKKKFEEFISEAYKMLIGYIKSYSILVSLTFLESLIAFTSLKLSYAFLLSLVCALLDIFPILGVGLIYFSLVIYFVIMKKYYMAIAVIIIYIIITIIRQIVEPKLVSSNLGLNPIMVLASIYIGVKAYGFLGMLYLIFLMVFYNILKKIQVI